MRDDQIHTYIINIAFCQRLGTLSCVQMAQGMGTEMNPYIWLSNRHSDHGFSKVNPLWRPLHVVVIPTSAMNVRIAPERYTASYSMMPSTSIKRRTEDRKYAIMIWFRQKRVRKMARSSYKCDCEIWMTFAEPHSTYGFWLAEFCQRIWAVIVGSSTASSLDKMDSTKWSLQGTCLSMTCLIKKNFFDFCLQMQKSRSGWRWATRKI